jgi:hypothetical protein
MNKTILSKTITLGLSCRRLARRYFRCPQFEGDIPTSQFRQFLENFVRSCSSANPKVSFNHVCNCISTIWWRLPRNFPNVRHLRKFCTARPPNNVPYLDNSCVGYHLGMWVHVAVFRFRYSRLSGSFLFFRVLYYQIDKRKSTYTYFLPLVTSRNCSC